MPDATFPRLGATRGALLVFCLASAIFVCANSAFASLPDQRAYELVSDSGIVGEPYMPPTPFGWQDTGVLSTSLPFQAASSGDAIAYAGDPANSGGNGEVSPGLGNQWFATRTAQGWQTENVTPAATGLAGTGSEAQYLGFSSDLQAAFLVGEQANPLTPKVRLGCAALYARHASTGEFSPLFTSGQIPETCGRPLFAGVSSDGAHVIFQSQAALTPEAEQATEIPAGHEGHAQGENYASPCMFGCNLYDASAGSLRLVNVIGAETVPNATFGGYPGERGYTNFSDAVSADGRRVFWTDTQEGPRLEHVYVRENGTTTVQVSGSGPAEYWAASADGRYAFYTEEGQLWRFDAQSNTRLQLAGEGAEVQGVIGTNQTGEDGAYLYFVANGVLAANENAHGDSAQSGLPNLYVRVGGTTSFIANLGEDDARIESNALGLRGSVWSAYRGERLANVSPDGRHLVFEATEPLTGYDNNVGENPQVEVFTYAADDASLSCASCEPNGAPPQIQEFRHTKLTESYLNATYVPHWMSDDGSRIFFNTAQGLVPQDTNGLQDVYEWEREGAGSCTAQAPARLNRGCIFLLSDGTSQRNAFLVDADASGDNVFFEHVGPLGQAEAPLDHNELYDARANGGFDRAINRCAAGGCETTPAPSPAVTAPASTIFVGSGNVPPPVQPSTKHKSAAQVRAEKFRAAVKACRRIRARKKRVRCEKTARANFGVKSTRKPSNNRRKGS